MSSSSKRNSSDCNGGRDAPPPYSSLQFDVDVERLPLMGEKKVRSTSLPRTFRCSAY